MSNSDQADGQAPGIDEVERNRIFVTMSATFKDEPKCRAAMETIVRDAHAAYGVTSHFWFRSDDGPSLFVIEQYADRSALSKAVRRFTSARISFFRSIKVNEVSVYGDVSFGLKAAFSPLRPTYMGYHAGFSKTVAALNEPGIKDAERDRVFVATNAIVRDTAASHRAIDALVEGAHAAAKTKSHFWTRSRDGKALFAVEQYADAKALREHLAADPYSTAAALPSVDVSDVTVYGAQPDEIKQMLAPLSPTYMSYYGGYSK